MVFNRKKWLLVVGCWLVGLLACCYSVVKKRMYLQQQQKTIYFLFDYNIFDIEERKEISFLSH